MLLFSSSLMKWMERRKSRSRYISWTVSMCILNFSVVAALKEMTALQKRQKMVEGGGEVVTLASTLLDILSLTGERICLVTV